VWSNTIVLQFFQMIGLVHSRILFSFKTCLIAWLAYFVRHLLQTRTKSSWISSTISKGGVFSFSFLCSNFYTSCKANVVEGRLFIGFDNAFVFALYSIMFPPFTRYTPFAMLLNGEYNFGLKGFLLESTTLSHPFFQCSLIIIFEFFLQWQ
jgi:hypothetical protein